jgi:hypothetical protein
MLEHEIDDPSELMSRSHISLGGTQACPLPAVVSPQPAVAVVKTLGCQAQGGISTILGLARLAAKHLATGYVILRTQAQPRGEMPASLPSAHLHARFRKNDLDSSGIAPVDGGQVHTGHLIEFGSQIKTSFVSSGAFAVFLGWGKGLA